LIFCPTVKAPQSPLAQRALQRTRRGTRLRMWERCSKQAATREEDVHCC